MIVNNYCPECKVCCGEKFCWRCGKESVSAILECPHCNADVSVIGAFCGNCGKPIQEAIKEHIMKERGGEKSGNAV
jgi:predicted amidophosphoribosyltransferase